MAAGQIIVRTATALDVCSDWTLAPRYGFLSDFAPDERNTAERLAAQSQVAPLYIEVWSPNDTYRDLHEIILNARRLRNGRSPVLAAYINAFLSTDESIRRGAVNALRLLTAAIFLNGGSQIILGEQNGVLCDPYFPPYVHLTPSEVRAVRADYDFISRHAEYFFDPAWRDISATRVGGINEETRLAVPRYGPLAEDNSIWTIVRERENEITLGLVNLCGGTARWNESKPKPRTVRPFNLTVRVPREIKRVYYLTPEQGGGATQLRFARKKGEVRLTLPGLVVWSADCLKVIELHTVRSNIQVSKVQGQRHVGMVNGC